MIRFAMGLTIALALGLPASADWTPTGVGSTGTTYWPQISPTGAQQELYINTDMGEVFHTNNFGSSWETINGGVGLGDAIVQFTADPNQRFAYDTVNSFHQTMDGGRTWSSAGLTLPPQGCPEGDQWFVDSTASGAAVRMVVRGRDNKIYLSPDSGHSWTVLKGGTNVTWVSGVLFDGNDFYIGTNDPKNISGTGLWKFSGGAFVSNIRDGLRLGDGIVSLAAVRAGAVLRFMALTRASGDIATSGAGQVWDNGTRPWNVCYLDTGGTGQWVNCNGSIPASAAASSIGAGNTANGPGAFYLFDTRGGAVYKSIGGVWKWGSNLFTKANTHTGYDGFVNFIAYTHVSAVNPDVIIMTNTTDLWGTSDGGKTWYDLACDPAYRARGADSHVANSTLNETSVWGLNFLDPDHFFAAATDTQGFRTIDGGKTWALPQWGPVADNTTYLTCTGPDGTLYETDAFQHDIYLGGGGLTDGWVENGANLGYSTDNGATWSQLSDVDTYGGTGGFGNLLTPRMRGGIFQVSNDPTFKTGVANLYTIGADETPSYMAYTTRTVKPGGAYRYARYLSPAGGWGVIGGIEFDADPNGSKPLLYTPHRVSQNQPALASPNTTYSGNLHQSGFVTPNTFWLNINVTGVGSVTIVDDGNGGVKVRRVDTFAVLPTVSGSIDYQTGAYAITLDGYTFTKDPASVNYTFASYGLISGGGILHNDSPAFGPAGAFDNFGVNTFSANTYFYGNQPDGCWVGMDFGSPQTLTQIKYAAPYTAGIIKGMAIDPSNPNRMYIAVCGLNTRDLAGVWYSDNFRSVLTGGTPSKVTWTHLGTGLDGVDSTGISSPNGSWQSLTVLKDGTVVLVAVARDPLNVPVPGNDTGSGVWVLPAGKTTWINRTGYYNGPGGLAHMDPNNPGVPLAINPYSRAAGWNFNQRVYAYSLYVSPLDPAENTWYLCVNRHGVDDTAGGLYLTTDRGEHWVKLPSPDGVTGAAINPLTRQMLLSTHRGIAYAPDAMHPMFSHVANFPYDRPVASVALNPFDLNQAWACTFGNGIYKGDLSNMGTPVAPSNLTATQFSASKIRLDWSNEDAPLGDCFKIEYSVDNASWKLLDTIYNRSADSYMAGDLSSETLYYFRIKASGFGTDSAASNVAHANTESTPGLIANEDFSYAPGALTGGNGGGGWSEPWTANGASVVQGNLTPDTLSGALTQDSASSAGHADIHEAPCSRTLKDSYGKAGSTLWISFVYSPAKSIGGLTLGNLRLGACFSNYGFISGPTYVQSRLPVAYDKPALIVARIRYESDVDNVTMWINPTPGSNTPPDDRAALDTGTKEEPRYSINIPHVAMSNIVTISGGGFGANVGYDTIRLGHSYADVTPGRPQPVPSAPVDLTATAALRNEIDLTWKNQASHAIGFTIESSPDGSTWNRLADVYTPDLCEYTVTGLPASLRSFFRLRAIGDSAESGYSNIADAMTIGNIPEAPTGLSASASGTTYALKWLNHASATTGCEVDCAPLYQPNASHLMQWTTLAGNLPAGAQSYDATIPVGDTKYIFRVQALSANGPASSNFACAAVPLAPTDLVATGVSSNGVLLTWHNRSTCATGFEVEKSADGANNWIKVGGTSADTLNFIASGLSPHTLCSFRVRAVGVNAFSQYPSVASGQTLPGTAILAYEPFNYIHTPGADGNLYGKNGGEGWSDAWSCVGDVGHGTIAPSSLLPPRAGMLAEIGNSITVHDSTLIRHTKSSFGKQGTTLWVSFVMTNGASQGGKAEGDISIGNLGVGIAWFGQWGFLVPGGTVQGQTKAALNTTNLLVARINYGTTNALTLWVDPAPGVQPSDDSAVVKHDYAGDLGVSNTVRIASPSYTTVVGYDEIRMGDSFLDVAPRAADGHAQ